MVGAGGAEVWSGWERRIVSAVVLPVLRLGKFGGARYALGGAEVWTRWGRRIVCVVVCLFSGSERSLALLVLRFPATEVAHFCASAGRHFSATMSQAS